LELSGAKVSGRNNRKTIKTYQKNIVELMIGLFTLDMPDECMNKIGKWKAKATE